MACSTSLSGYDSLSHIGRFYNRDAGNEVGFEMRMTLTEYNALSRFIEKLSKDIAYSACDALADNVRRALPTPAEAR